MLKRCFTLAIVVGAFSLRPLCGQAIAPAAVVSHVTLSRAPTVRAEPEPRHSSATPYVLIGGLVGAGAVTTFWVQAAVANARKNGNDGMIFPPIIYVTVGAGAVGGGLLGWVIHDAVTHPN